METNPNPNPISELEKKRKELEALKIRRRGVLDAKEGEIKRTEAQRDEEKTDAFFEALEPLRVKYKAFRENKNNKEWRKTHGCDADDAYKILVEQSKKEYEYARVQVYKAWIVYFGEDKAKVRLDELILKDAEMRRNLDVKDKESFKGMGVKIKKGLSDGIKWYEAWGTEKKDREGYVKFVKLALGIGATAAMTYIGVSNIGNLHEALAKNAKAVTERGAGTFMGQRILMGSGIGLGIQKILASDFFKNKLGTGISKAKGVSESISSKYNALSKKEKLVYGLLASAGVAGLAIGGAAAVGGLANPWVLRGLASTVGFGVSRVARKFLPNEESIKKDIQASFSRHLDMSGDDIESKLAALEGDVADVIRRSESKRIAGKVLELGVAGLVGTATLETSLHAASLRNSLQHTGILHKSGVSSTSSKGELVGSVTVGATSNTGSTGATVITGVMPQISPKPEGGFFSNLWNGIKSSEKKLEHWVMGDAKPTTTHLSDGRTQHTYTDSNGKGIVETWNKEGVVTKDYTSSNGSLVHETMETGKPDTFKREYLDTNGNILVVEKGAGDTLERIYKNPNGQGKFYEVYIKTNKEFTQTLKIEGKPDQIFRHEIDGKSDLDSLTSSSIPNGRAIDASSDIYFVHKGEGVESALIRQIKCVKGLATQLNNGTEVSDENLEHFAQVQAHLLALKAGYVDANNPDHQVWISQANKAGFQICFDTTTGKPTINELVVGDDGKIQNLGDTMGSDFGPTDGNKYEYGHISTPKVEAGASNSQEFLDKLTKAQQNWQELQNMQARFATMGTPTNVDTDVHVIDPNFVTNQMHHVDAVGATETTFDNDDNMIWGREATPAYSTFDYKSNQDLQTKHILDLATGAVAGKPSAFHQIDLGHTVLGSATGETHTIDVGGTDLVVPKDFSQANVDLLKTNASFIAGVNSKNVNELLDLVKINQSNFASLAIGIRGSTGVSLHDKFAQSSASELIDENSSPVFEVKVVNKYLLSLQKLSNLRPIKGGTFLKDETVDHFAGRAIQVIKQKGLEDSLFDKTSKVEPPELTPSTLPKNDIIFPNLPKPPSIDVASVVENIPGLNTNDILQTNSFPNTLDGFDIHRLDYLGKVSDFMKHYNKEFMKFGSGLFSYDSKNNSLYHSSNGEILALFDINKEITIFSIESGELKPTYLIHPDGSTDNVSLSGGKINVLDKLQADSQGVLHKVKPQPTPAPTTPTTPLATVLGSKVVTVTDVNTMPRKTPKASVQAVPVPEPAPVPPPPTLSTYTRGVEIPNAPNAPKTDSDSGSFLDILTSKTVTVGDTTYISKTAHEGTVWGYEIRTYTKGPFAGVTERYNHLHHLVSKVDKDGSKYIYDPDEAAFTKGKVLKLVRQEIYNQSDGSIDLYSRNPKGKMSMVGHINPDNRTGYKIVNGEHVETIYIQDKDGNYQIQEQRRSPGKGGKTIVKKINKPSPSRSSRSNG